MLIKEIPPCQTARGDQRPKVVTMDTKFGMGAVGAPVGAYLAVLGAQFEPVGARRPEDRETI